MSDDRAERRMNTLLRMLEKQRERIVELEEALIEALAMPALSDEEYQRISHVLLDIT